MPVLKEKVTALASALHTGTQMDGATEGEGGGRRKAAQLKRVFCPSPVRIARSLARRPGLVGCAAGCAFITLFNEIRFQPFQESWITCQAVRSTYSFCDCGHDTIST